MASPVQVLIATTEGPLAIKRVMHSPLKKSKVFGSNAREPLRTLSANYDAFVKARIPRIPSNDREQSFRLDLSGDIDVGNSWQLGVFLAHTLATVDRLAGGDQEEATGSIVVATGEIDQDLRAIEVGSVEVKLRALIAEPRIEQALHRGRTVIIAVPDANSADGKSEQEALQNSGALIIPISSVEQLLDKLDMKIALLPPGADDAWEGSPFRGLEVFEQRHRRIFFGRGKAREETLLLLRRQVLAGCGFLLIHGSSGVGKSSLVRAGLLGDIEQLGSATDRWRSAVVVPSRAHETPLAALAGALADQVPELQLESAALAELILASPAAAAKAVTAALGSAHDGGRVRLALLVDQLEDLLLWAQQQKTQEAAKEREAFAEVVSRLARSGLVWVIATLRSDLLALLDDSPILSDLSRDDRLYRLERPRRGALKEIIIRPATLAGVNFAGRDEDGLELIDVLVDAAGGQQSCLPLLQFALKRLYDNSETRTISYQQYKEIGTLERAIGDWADSTVNNLGDDPVTVRAIDDVILNLGRRGREGDVVVANEVLLDENFATAARENVIRALEQARLIVIDADEKSRQRTARVAHEALLTRWPRARSLFEAEGAMLTLGEDIERSAKRWEKSNDKAFLIPAGRPLIEAENLLMEGRVALTELTRDFIKASLSERKLAQESARARLAREEQSISGLMRAGDFLGAATELEQLVKYIGEQHDAELREPQLLHEQRRRRIGRIAEFYTSARQVDALAGEEDFGKAPIVCEAALRSLGVFDDAQWWEHVPTEDLEPIQIEDLRQDIYRTLLLFTALMLVPGMVALFSGKQAGPPSAWSRIVLDILGRLLPTFVIAAVIRRGGVGSYRLPARMDNAEARTAFARSLSVLKQVWHVEEAMAKARGQPPQRSRASHLVERLALVLQEFASGPKDSAVDYGQWIGSGGPARFPEPVNAVDYFFIGLFNYFVAKRSRDGVAAKIVSLLQATFPDLDARTPLATAERLLRRAIELEPRYYWAHWVLGRTLAESGKHDSAELAFNGAVAIDPNYARGYEQRALAIANQWKPTGDQQLRARAEADSQRAAEFANGDPSIFWPRGELLELLGETRAALESYSLWLELEEDILAKIARGSGVERLSNYAGELLGDTSSAVLHADAHALLALVHLTRKDHDKALTAAQDARAIDPDHPHALTAIGVALQEMGEPGRAIDEGLDPALQLDPFNFRALLHRARACEQIDPGEAGAAWQKLLDPPLAATHHRCPPWMMMQARVAIDRIGPRQRSSGA